LILFDAIIFDDTLWLDDYHTIMVALNLVCFNEKLFFSLDDKYTLTLWVRYDVVLNFTLSTLFSAQCNVSFYILIDLICYNLSIRALHNKDALVVVGDNQVAIREVFELHDAALLNLFNLIS
jgi:hypothetical protein